MCVVGSQETESPNVRIYEKTRPDYHPEMFSIITDSYLPWAVILLLDIW